MNLLRKLAVVLAALASVPIAQAGIAFSGNAFSGGLVGISSDVSGDSFGAFIFDLIVPPSRHIQSCY